MRLADSIIAEYRAGTPTNAIAQKCGTTKVYAATIITEHLTGKQREPPRLVAPKPPRQRNRKKEEASFKVGTIAKCRTCGGRVQVPCRLCAVRGEQKL